MAAVDVVLHILDAPDPCSLVGLIGLLTLVGNLMTRNLPRSHAWGYRLSASAFICYGIYAAWMFEPATAGELLEIAVRSLLAAGCALGFSWITLAVCEFIVQAPAARLERWRQSIRNKEDYERAERERAEKLRREREEYERAAPERERARQEDIARAQSQAQAQKRRFDVRAQCEYFYHLYSPEIEIRFPRHKFDDFVAKYLSDRQSPEEVEAHAESLRKLLNMHVEKVNPRPRFTTIGELTNWYSDQKAEVDAMADGPLKSSLVAMLHVRYAELTTHLLEELAP